MKTNILSHIIRRSHDDRFHIPLREAWFYSRLGVPIPTLVGHPQQYSYRPCGDHLQTCHHQSTTLPTHDWVIYCLSLFLRSIGHPVKIHKITPVVGKEHGDIEVNPFLIRSVGSILAKTSIMRGFHSPFILGHS